MSSTALPSVAPSPPLISNGCIDFLRVGRLVASRLTAHGHALSSTHLDILHSLPFLERVWLASHTRRGVGLTEMEFVDFLSGASHMSQSALMILFEKMDINSERRLSWDEYLSYLVRELACKWRMAAGAGTYIVKEDDSKSVTIQSETATTISQLLILPQVGNALFPTYTSKVVARCKNDTIQVFDSNSLQYLYHVPLHAPVKKRKKIWTYEQDESSNEIAIAPNAHEAQQLRPSTANSTTQPTDEKMLLYNVDQSTSSSTEQKFRNSMSIHEPNQVDPGILHKLKYDRGWMINYGKKKSEIERLRREAEQRLLEGEEVVEVEEEKEQQQLPTSSRTRPNSAVAAALKLSASNTPTQSHTSSIKFLPKSPAGRPVSASPRIHFDQSALAGANSTDPKIRSLLTSNTNKFVYNSVRDRKLETYLSAVELISAVPIAQPLACVGQQRLSGRPPPAERPASAGGVMHREFLELTERNSPYAFPLTSMTQYKKSKQIVVSASDRSIRLFGLVRRTFECQDLFYVHETPQCLEIDELSATTFAGMHGQPNKSLLFIGSSTGSVTAYNPTTHARVANLANLHTNQTVKKVQLFPQVGLVAAGMDGRLSIIDPCTFQCTRFLGRVSDNGTGDVLVAATQQSTSSSYSSTTSYGHHAGVFSFALCKTNRMLLSVGFDREVYLWDPHLSQPTWKLPTQNTDLLDVLVNESKNQILLISKDQKVRVFDMRNFKQIQETLDTTEYFPLGRLTSAVFDDQKQELLTAANKISVWKIEPSLSNKAALASAHAQPTDLTDGDGKIAVQSQKAHVSNIIAILYSWVFNQVVTVCENESIRVWDIFNGCRGPTFEFNTTHHSTLTSASLDWNGKRLLTSSHSGSIFMWNFNNGELLYKFELWAQGRLEINRISMLSTINQCLIGIGWSKNVIRWPVPVKESGKPLSIYSEPGATKTTHITEQEGHTTQILALATFGNLIVTGDAAGELITWVADSGHKLYTYQLPKTSYEYQLDRDEGAHSGSPNKSRQPCSPAITCLEFFLVHDLASYDTWHKISPAALDPSLIDPQTGRSIPPPPSNTTTSLSNPPDYRQQHLHFHRAAIFVGTDDGSIYIFSPQGLVILHSNIHLMSDPIISASQVTKNDTIQTISLIQTMHWEEVTEELLPQPPLESFSRRVSLVKANLVRKTSLTSGQSTSDATLPVAPTKTATGAVTKSGLEAATARLQQALESTADPVSTDEQKTTRRTSSISFDPRPTTPRFHNPFARQKKVVFTAPPPVNAVDEVSPSTEPVDAAAAIEDEFAREVAELAYEQAHQEDGEQTMILPTYNRFIPQRKPFLTTPGTFKLAPTDSQPEEIHDEIADALSLEEYLTIKRNRAAKKAELKAEAEAKLLAAEQKDQTKVESTTDTTKSTAEIVAAATTDVTIATSSQPHIPKLSLVVDQLRSSNRKYRRVLHTHLLVTDGAASSEGKLFSVTTEPAPNASMTLYRGSPSIADQRISLTLVKSMYLHAPPNAVVTAKDRPNYEDSTSTVRVIEHPTLGLEVFLVGSANGHASIWSADGEYLCSLGQSPSKGWPLKRPEGFNFLDSFTPLSPKWPSANALKPFTPKPPPMTEEELQAEREAQAALAEDDIWSDEEDELTAEEERVLISMQSQALGFAADDSSITAMLAAVRKKKINNDDAKRGMAMGAAFAGPAGMVQLKNTAAAGGGGLGGPGTQQPSEPELERPITAPSVRSEKQKARLRRLKESPRLRYVESFRPQSARLARSNAAAGNGSVDTRPFAVAHPQYIPETLRENGLRSAMFLNDSKLRQGKTREEMKEAEAAQQRMRARDAELFSAPNMNKLSSPTNAASSSSSPMSPRQSSVVKKDVNDFNFFQLAPRDQALSDSLHERARQTQSLENFLQDPKNLVDEKTGAVKDHGVARLAIQFGAIESGWRKKKQQQIQQQLYEQQIKQEQQQQQQQQQHHRSQSQHSSGGGSFTARSLHNVRPNVFKRLSSSQTNHACHPSCWHHDHHQPGSHGTHNQQHIPATQTRPTTAKTARPASSGSSTARRPPSASARSHSGASTARPTPHPPPPSSHPSFQTIHHLQTHTPLITPVHTNIQEEERVLHQKAVDARRG